MDQGRGSGIRAIHHVTKRIGREVATLELLLRREGETWLAGGAGRLTGRQDAQLSCFH